jgi:hypothetical protein
MRFLLEMCPSQLMKMILNKRGPLRSSGAGQREVRFLPPPKEVKNEVV